MKRFPAAQTILLIISALVAILTWVVPAGQYATLLFDDTNNVFIETTPSGVNQLPATQETLNQLNIQIPLENFTSGAIYKSIGIPGTYTALNANPQGFFDLAQAPVKGIIETADIIFLVLIIGGLVGIVEKTGAFSAGISWLSRTLQGRENILIISTTILTALGGTTFGFGEEGIAFLPILIPIFMAAGYDALIAISCVFVGSHIGILASVTNPFATILASDAAGISWTTGINGRIAILVITLLITIIYLLRYARRIKADPTRSILFDQRAQLQAMFGIDDQKKIPELTIRKRLILVTFTLCFVIMITGVIKFDWWFIEMTSTFLVGSIIVGFLARMNEQHFIKAFMSGAGALLGVVFIIGIARGISILMTDGMISDTILFHANNITRGMGKGLFINVLFGIYNGLTFFIPSTSGMAVLTMPIMAPLADNVNIGRENIVNAYLFGMGIFNLVNPTALILAYLGMAQIGYNRYLKFIWPLVLIMAVVCMIFLTVSII